MDHVVTSTGVDCHVLAIIIVEDDIITRLGINEYISTSIYNSVVKITHIQANIQAFIVDITANAAIVFRVYYFVVIKVVAENIITAVKASSTVTAYRFDIDCFVDSACNSSIAWFNNYIRVHNL